MARREPLFYATQKRRAVEEAALEAALSQVKDTANAERALQAARRLCDLQAHFFYRVGLQDGVKLAASDFPVCGIDKNVC